MIYFVTELHVHTLFSYFQYFQITEESRKLHK